MASTKPSPAGRTSWPDAEAPTKPDTNPPPSDATAWGEKILRELANMEGRVNGRLDRVEEAVATIPELKDAVHSQGEKYEKFESRLWDVSVEATEAAKTAAAAKSAQESLELRVQLSRGVLGGAGGGAALLGVFELLKAILSSVSSSH